MRGTSLRCLDDVSDIAFGICAVIHQDNREALYSNVTGLKIEKNHVRNATAEEGSLLVPFLASQSLKVRYQMFGRGRMVDRIGRFGAWESHPVWCL